MAYSKLSSTEEGQATLDGLGISDGASLRDFAGRVGSGDAEALQQLNDAMAGASPSFQGDFAAALGAQNPEAGATAVQAARAQAGNEQAEGWPEGITNDDAKQLESWGITQAQAQEARDALPDLLAAAKAAGEGQLPLALEYLASAAQKAPELTAQAMAAMTQDMEDGPLKTALNDPALPGLLGQLAAGDWSGAAATLEANPSLLGAAGEALASLPAVQTLLGKLGISVEDLPAAEQVLPEVLKLGSAVTAEPPDVKGAAEAVLAIAGKVDGAAFSGLMDKLGGVVPDSVKGFFQKLAENPDVQAIAQALANDPNLPTLLDQLSKQDWTGALDTLSQNPELATAVGNALANIPQVQALLEKMGISAADLPNLGEVFGDALKLGQAVTANPPDVKAAAEAVLAIAGKVDGAAFSGLMDKLGGLVPDSVKGFFQKLAENPDVQAIAQALANDPNLPTLIDQLSKQDWTGALETLGQNPALVGAVGDALANIPQIQTLLTNLGIDTSKLPSLGEVLPDLLKFGGALFQEPRDVQAAVEAALSFAGKLDPQAFAGLINKLGEHLPIPESAKQLINTLVNDPLFKDLVGSAHFAPALAALLQGDPGGAIRELAQDPALLASIGARVGEALGLPQGVVDALIAAKDVLLDPEIGPALKDLGIALAKGSPEEALAALETLAGAIASKATSTDPAERAKLVQLLDAMGKLPGGLGKLFQDHDLNQALVEAGSVGHLVEAAKLLAQGKLEDAAGALYAAGESLLNYGEGKIEVPGFGELPFTKDGLTMFVKLFGRFFDALPNGVKNKIQEIVGKAVGSAVPIIGDLITGAMDVEAFIDAMKNGDGLDKLIAGGQLALDAAGALQLTKAFTQPLKFALAALQAVRTVNDMAQIVSNFQGVFFGVEGDPDQEVKTQDRAIAEAYFGAGQAAGVQERHGLDEQGLASLVAAAQACNIPPEQFDAFVSALAEGRSLGDVVQLLNSAREGGPGGADAPTRLRQAVHHYLPDNDLSAFGGHWPPQPNELANPDDYLNDQVKAEFEAEFGDDIELDRWGEYDISPYEALVAQARALGVPPERFMEFCRFLQTQGIDLRDFAEQLSDKLSWWSIRSDPSTPGFDATEWLRNGFMGEYPGVMEQFLQPQPTAAAA